MDTAPDPSGLDRRRIGALIDNLLGDEPHLERHDAPEGTVYFVRAPPGDHAGSPPGPVRMCAIGTDGGMLLRLSAEDLTNYLEAGSVTGNAALPEWVAQVTLKAAVAFAADFGTIQGDPVEWAWVAVQDEHGFTKRKPILLEAVAYGRYCIENDITSVTAADNDGRGQDGPAAAL